MFEDTIIAISTPMGYGGIGIVRLSGSKAFSIARRIFTPNKPPDSWPPRRPVLGRLHDLDQQESFEEGLLTGFPSPHSYTSEDVVELSCHGSPVILEEIVRLGVKAGARHASPGEFTLRAYLHGRLDILQAEAVDDIIRASTLKQAKISFHQLEGSLSRAIGQIRSDVVGLLARIEAGLEFPDENLGISSREILEIMSSLSRSILDLIESYDLGKGLSEGLTLTMIGRANVGKSTLFNALLQEDRAIVTPYPGTTRDFLREKIRIKDAIFNLVDTAGMTESGHPVENEGIKRGKKIAEEADGLLLILDASEKETPEDLDLLDRFNRDKTIVLFNKSDLPRKMDISGIRRSYPDLATLDISALKLTHLDRLKILIYSHFVPECDKNEEIILHLRQKILLENIHESLLSGMEGLEKGLSEEVFVEEIRGALPLLGQLTGDIRPDEIMNDIFSRFCVGK